MDKNVNIKEIKGLLPHGAITEIAKRSGVSYVTLLKVLNGESNNMKALEGITRYVLELKRKKKDLNNRILKVLA